MNAQEVESYLHDNTAWIIADPKARAAFLKEMEYRNYGFGPLRDAWGWFIMGWVQRGLHLNTQRKIGMLRKSQG